jgi:hypothetical protein
MQENVKVSKFYLDILNQIFEIEKKAGQIQESNSIARNINRLREIFDNELPNPLGTGIGLIYVNPLGEDYNETRTDCEANIAGVSTENLKITEVIKPIIYYRDGGRKGIVQKGVVVVEEAKL